LKVYATTIQVTNKVISKARNCAKTIGGLSKADIDISGKNRVLELYCSVTVENTGINLQPTDLTGDPGLGALVGDDGLPGEAHYPVWLAVP